MSTQKVKFIFERSTKGAHRFQEIDPETQEIRTQQDPDCVIGTLYVRKKGFGSNAPLHLENTIESFDKKPPHFGGNKSLRFRHLTKAKISMLTIKVQNLTTGKTVVCDVLSHSRFRMRLVPEGTTVPIDFHRQRELHSFHATSHKMSGLILETTGEMWGNE